MKVLSPGTNLTLKTNQIRIDNTCQLTPKKFVDKYAGYKIVGTSRSDATRVGSIIIGYCDKDYEILYEHPIKDIYTLGYTQDELNTWKLKKRGVRALPIHQASYSMKHFSSSPIGRYMIQEWIS